MTLSFFEYRSTQARLLHHNLRGRQEPILFVGMVYTVQSLKRIFHSESWAAPMAKRRRVFQNSLVVQANTPMPKLSRYYLTIDISL